VDSANVGPYGEAINHELIPAVEKQFRGIGKGWARAVYGGSTGGWEALATQVFYPDDFNGAWGACPDPVDFHAYQRVNVYEDQNAYFTSGPFSRVRQPEMRTVSGQILATTEGTNRGSWHSARAGGPASSGASGKPCSAPSVPTAIPLRSGTSAPASSITPSPNTGANTTT
jgi:hypothetical protein